jgi:hypothetical protein
MPLTTDLQSDVWKKARIYTENVLLAYFGEKSKDKNQNPLRYGGNTP